MASPMNGRTLADALRAEGVKVVEHPGWLTHNRNHKGAWGEVHGVMIHHTVTSDMVDAVKICHDGFATLPGPLCHGVIERDGTVYLISSGRANHAGGGDPDVLAAVKNEDYENRPPAPNVHDGSAGTSDGNRAFYGFECANLGDGKDPWPAVQVEAIVRASAALCRVHDWGAKSVIGHLEWSDWKSDPKGVGVAMPDLRRRIAERLNHEPSWSRPGTTPSPAPVPRPTPGGTSMEPIDFWNYRNANADKASQDAGHGRIPDAYGYLVLTHQLLVKLRAEVAELRTAVNALARSQAGDAER